MLSTALPSEIPSPSVSLSALPVCRGSGEGSCSTWFLLLLHGVSPAQSGDRAHPPLYCPAPNPVERSMLCASYSVSSLEFAILQSFQGNVGFIFQPLSSLLVALDGLRFRLPGYHPGAPAMRAKPAPGQQGIQVNDRGEYSEQ